MNTKEQAAKAAQVAALPKNTVNPAKANEAKAQDSAKPNEQGKPEEHKAQGATGQAAPEPDTIEPAKAETLVLPVAQPKMVMNLEATLKHLEAMQRLATQRENLLNRIETLEEFEIMLIENADELTGNHFAGCKLIIQDGMGRTFNTNTPNLIKAVAEYVQKTCLDKLAEIEAGLVFPNAA